jgi:carbon storage regulator
MLVLSRKKGESIVIDGNIVITVVEVRGDKVRLGIEAPIEIPVMRSELVPPVVPVVVDNTEPLRATA